MVDHVRIGLYISYILQEELKYKGFLEKYGSATSRSMHSSIITHSWSPEHNRCRSFTSKCPIAEQLGLQLSLRLRINCRSKIEFIAEDPQRASS